MTPGAPESPDLSALALLGLDAMGDNLGTKEKCFAGFVLLLFLVHCICFVASICFVPYVHFV